jgi:hypothetical protein
MTVTAGVRERCVLQLRKLLSEEKRSCHLEGERIREFHHLFEQVSPQFGVIFCLGSFSRNSPSSPARDYLYWKRVNTETNIQQCQASQTVLIRNRIRLVTLKGTLPLRTRVIFYHMKLKILGVFCPVYCWCRCWRRVFVPSEVVFVRSSKN